MKKYQFKDNIIKEKNDNYNLVFYDNIAKLNDENLDKTIILDLKDIDNHSKIDFYQDSLYGKIAFSKSIFNLDLELLFIFSDNKLFFIIEDLSEVGKIINLLNKNLAKFNVVNDNIALVILEMIRLKVDNDLHYIDKLKTKIEALENTLIVDKEYQDYNVKLLKIRKQLAKYRKENNYLSDFLDIIEYSHNSFNGLDSIIKVIKYHNNRLTTDLTIMIEHVIQIKEVYQNQLDVNLNNTMNLFTIISAIFLPLTLITSWYGMNFGIPEYALKFGYLIPIILCLFSLSVIVHLIRKHQYLKKK